MGSSPHPLAEGPPAQDAGKGNIGWFWFLSFLFFSSSSYLGVTFSRLACHFTGKKKKGQELCPEELTVYSKDHMTCTAL